MSDLARIVDALLPGDDVLPSGTAAGVAIDESAHRDVLAAIARAGGGEEGIRAAEREVPAELAALLYDVVERYYDADVVLVSLGWRTEPPQPRGHALEPFDDGLLAKVRRRAPLWRDPR